MYFPDYSISGITCNSCQTWKVTKGRIFTLYQQCWVIRGIPPGRNEPECSRIPGAAQIAVALIAVTRPGHGIVNLLSSRTLPDLATPLPIIDCAGIANPKKGEQS